MVAEDVTTGVSPYGSACRACKISAGQAADGRQGVSCLRAPRERAILPGLVCAADAMCRVRTPLP